MYCPHCGTANDGGNQLCASCARPIQVGATAGAPQALGDSPAMRMLLPVGRSWLAIAAGYAGLFALVIFPAPLAVLLGILAVRDIRKNPKKHGMGRAIFGIVMGALGTLVLVILLVGAFR